MFKNKYVKRCRSLRKIGAARELFGKVEKRDCVIWNVMLNGFAKCGDLDSGMRMDGIRPNAVTFDCVLSLCAYKSLIDLGVQVSSSLISSSDLLKLRPSQAQIRGGPTL
ncbi:unnamed protein product [Eruca vesicaria subsp. sativa]|uniref:Pentatricopeptide repeat-containing protein n=1 Tax=Eruca vesicaria subsp. sativa TaxID=29727 RepID=A0ABC8L0I3_ERUVS|nr:unnamed protein product [Eruca vesicaria subsp. sativa]